MPLLSNRLQFQFAGILGAGAVDAFRCMWRIRREQPEVLARALHVGRQRAMVAFWHRHLFTLLCAYRGAKFCVPVSEHRDGEYIAQIMERCGFLAVRGSSTRGGARLLRNVIRACEDGWSCAITPDGPQGPIYSVKPGFVMLARRCKVPVLPVGVAATPAWEMSSWDRFLVPRPWARVQIAVGRMIQPGEIADVDHDGACALLKGALTAANDRAQELLARW